MKVAIIGSGGREHALCDSLKKSSKVNKIYCIPGNAGTDLIAENVKIELNDFEAIKEFIKLNALDLVLVGPEKPLVEGIVDFLEKHNVKVFGPNKIASQLEGSKAFTKNLCKKYNIPTANFGIFEDSKSALNFLKSCNLPIVIKADGLASGKGVYICEKKEEYIEAVKEIFGGKFGEAKQILIEEFLKGEEMSFFVICDGENYKKFSTAQDHKRVVEGDKGKNTGGMGAYSPSRLINKNLEKKILDRIIIPTLEALKKLKTSYKGFLYAGLMIVKGDPYLIEYNVRMGDPECQTILPMLNTDLFEILDSCCEKKLQNVKIEWSNKKSLCVVLCSNGYPDTYEKNIEIKDLDLIKLKNDDYLFHAGTSLKNEKIFATGGRVLNFVSLSNEFVDAKKSIYKNLDTLNWSEGFYRKDIGFKVIDT